MLRRPRLPVQARIVLRAAQHGGERRKDRALLRSVGRADHAGRERVLLNDVLTVLLRPLNRRAVLVDDGIAVAVRGDRCDHFTGQRVGGDRDGVVRVRRAWSVRREVLRQRAVLLQRQADVIVDDRGGHVRPGGEQIRMVEDDRLGGLKRRLHQRRIQIHAFDVFGRSRGDAEMGQRRRMRAQRRPLSLPAEVTAPRGHRDVHERERQFRDAAGIPGRRGDQIEPDRVGRHLHVLDEVRHAAMLRFWKERQRRVGALVVTKRLGRMADQPV